MDPVVTAVPVRPLVLPVLAPQARPGSRASWRRWRLGRCREHRWFTRHRWQRWRRRRWYRWSNGTSAEPAQSVALVVRRGQPASAVRPAPVRAPAELVARLVSVAPVARVVPVETGNGGQHQRWQRWPGGLAAAPGYRMARRPRSARAAQTVPVAVAVSAAWW